MKVMILGANAHQARAIERAKAMGHVTVAVDNRWDSPGKMIAHEAVYASTFDVAACIQAGRDHKIDGVFTSGTDQPVLTAACVQKALGLPMPFTEDLARRLTNKRWMKSRFDHAHLPTLPWTLVGRGYEEAEIPFDFPLVIKPVDSQGQRGIFLVENHDQLRGHLEESLSYSREDRIMAEAYYPSDEVTVSGWVTDGQAVILSITDRESFQTKGQLGICLSHEHPTRYADALGDELEGLTHDIVEAFDIETGPIYFQFLIGESGIVINEIAGRIGGAHEDVMVPATTGFDLLESQIRLALGQPVAKPHPVDWKQPGLRASVQLFFVEPCRIEQIIEPGPGRLKSLVELGLHIHQGQIIDAIENATARAGYAIFLSESEACLQADVENFYREMKILDPAGRNRIVKHHRRKRT